MGRCIILYNSWVAKRENKKGENPGKGLVSFKGNIWTCFRGSLIEVDRGKFLKMY